jgi:glycosyltransferase involved in cell wall biosynthesis
MARKRVCIISTYPLSLARGGLEIQAERTYEEMSLRDPGLEYTFMDWKTRELADLYHFVGIAPHLREIIRSVEQAGRPYICHILTGSRQRFYSYWVREQVKKRLGMETTASTLKGAARVIMITEQEKDLLGRAFSIPREKLVVVPNFVDEAFFDTTDEVWKRERGEAPFLLCVGMVQPRKNQLLLVRAANAERLPVVLIGQPLPGLTAYAQEVEAEMKINEGFGGGWIKGLLQTDPLLISAHRACRAFVLLSEAETQPLSILQAMAAQRPVLLGRSFYTNSEPFATLPQVRLDRFEEIRQGLRAIWDSGQAQPLPEAYRTQNVVQTLGALYREVLQASGA